MITGKNKEQFEKWYKEYHKPNAGRTKYFIGNFFRLEFEMQQGVLLAYYDSLGIIIEHELYINLNDTILGHYVKIKTIFKRKVITFKGVYKGHSRNEALTEAFKQADKLENEKLK